MNERSAPPANGPRRPAPSPGTTPTPSDEEVARGRGMLRWFLAAFVATVLSSNLQLPFKLVALAFGIAAVVLGILTLVHAVRYRLGAFLRITSAVGVGFAAFLTLGIAAAVALWPVTENFENCMRTALTIQAERECQDRLRDLDGLLSN